MHAPHLHDDAGRTPPPGIRPSLAALSALAALAGAHAVAARPDPGAPRADAVQASTTLVINEIDYDQPSTDSAEFIEIKNVSAGAIDLDPYSVELINGTGGGAASYSPGPIDLPAFLLPAGGYFVICGDAATTPNCDLDVTGTSDVIQNGAPDAIGLLLGETLVDAVSYEGNSGAPYTEGSGVGLADNPANANEGISRIPDGADTDMNNVDFSSRCITPGQPNTSSSAPCAAPVTNTPTGTATSTATNTPTDTATNTPTNTPTSTPTDTPTNTPTDTSGDPLLDVTITDPFGCTGAGDVLDVEIVLTNVGPDPAQIGVSAVFSGGLSGVVGSCTFVGGVGGMCDVTATDLFWTATVPGTASAPANVATIHYQVQVGGAATLGTQLCITSTADIASLLLHAPDATVVQVCTTVDCGAPTSATMAYARAIGWRDGVILAWETASETDLVGFNVFRGPTADGPFTSAGAGFVPARGAAGGGAPYVFRDQPGEGRFHYRLETVAASGPTATYRVGPVDAGARATGARAFLPALGGAGRGRFIIDATPPGGVGRWFGAVAR